MDSEPVVRLGFYAGTFAVVALWEVLRATRTLSHSKRKRWSRNLILMGLSSLAVRLLIPATAIEIAALAAEHRLGLLNLLGMGSSFVGIVLAVVLLDLCIYLQHIVFHVYSPLWRLHMVHHADPDFDVTTGARFHPIEIMISMLVKCTLIVAIGASALAVLIFEVILNAAATFNHGNVSLPAGLDRIARFLIVTPDMHRIHHSIETRETHSNYGFNLPWWDRLFGTYIPEPGAGQRGMTIGLKHLSDEKESLPLAMLKMPFSESAGDYPSYCSPNRRRIGAIGVAAFFVSLAYAVTAYL